MEPFAEPCGCGARSAGVFKFLKSKPVLAVTLLLLAQAAVLYSSVRPEKIPDSRPLSGLAPDLGSWKLAKELDVDDETRDVLKADDLLYRAYQDGSTGLAAT